jgi:plasmid stabilization system protein ParE
VDSIAERVSVASARRWATLLRTAIVDLADTAETHAEADEAATVRLDLRMRLAGRGSHVYRILYTFTSDEVLIHRVRHAAQDYLTEGDL